LGAYAELILRGSEVRCDSSLWACLISVTEHLTNLLVRERKFVRVVPQLLLGKDVCSFIS